MSCGNGFRCPRPPPSCLVCGSLAQEARRGVAAANSFPRPVFAVFDVRGRGLCRATSRADRGKCPTLCERRQLVPAQKCLRHRGMDRSRDGARALLSARARRTEGPHAQGALLVDRGTTVDVGDQGGRRARDCSGACDSAGLGAVTKHELSASRKSEGFVTLWIHPRWRDSVLIAAVTVFSHAGQIVTRSQLHEQTRLFVDGLPVAPARVEPWHPDATALVFRFPRPPKHFKIVIRDVPDVPTRVLTW